MTDDAARRDPVAGAALDTAANAITEPSIAHSRNAKNRELAESPAGQDPRDAEASHASSGRRTPKGGDVTVSFSSPFTDPGTRISGLRSCGATQPGVCSVAFHGGAGRFTGALTTVADYYGHFWLDPIGMTLIGESWDRHVGSLAGCATGSFVMHQTEIIPVAYTRGTDFRPAKRGPAEAHVHWDTWAGVGAR